MKQQSDKIYLGHRHEWGSEIPFGINLHDRKQHVYVIGQTGTGKTTLLRNLILQDIDEGRGVALIDPHGDMAQDILDHIPKRRMDDVVYFDPTSEAPLAINLFRVAGDNWHLAVSGIVSAFRKIWADSWGPRLEYVLFATLGALSQCQNTSLLGVSRMLSDARYRAWVVKQVKDPMIRSFWVNEFEKYDKRFAQEVISPIQNKVGQLFFSPQIRQVLGQVRSKVDFRFMMDNRRIFIANLSKGHLGETHSSLLGALLVTGFEIAALSRADMPPEKRKEFFLYADEFQNYSTDSFAGILSESRKYGLCLTLAHQYVGQLSEDVTKAIFGNVGSLIAFRVGEADASVLERQFGTTYTRAQFTSLENFEICVRLLNQDPFLGRSLAPISTQRKRSAKFIRHSRLKYGTKKSIGEARIKRWLRL